MNNFIAKRVIIHPLSIVIAALWFLPGLSANTHVMSPMVLRPGESRFDGHVQSVDSRKGSFVLKVRMVTSAGKPTKAKPSAKTKKVLINATSLFSQERNPAQRIVAPALKPGMSVTVFGADAGGQQTLSARLIILDAGPNKLQKNMVNGGTPEISSSRFRIKVNGRSHSGTLVKVHLDTVRIKVALGRNQVGLTEPLASMAKRHHALVGINGSYFQAYNTGHHKPPVMTLITGGQAVFTGDIGTILGFTAENAARMDRAPVVLTALNNGANALHHDSKDPAVPDTASVFWPQAQEAVGCGPRLVVDGRVSLNMRAEKFTDSKVLVLATARSAVGLTRDRHLLLVTTSGTIPQLAGIMKALGAYQAMNLDGGASSGLWMRGRYLRSPGRSLSNALLILPR